MTLLHGLSATIPAREFSIATQARSGERKPMETYDDLLVRVEEKASGFGGMFIDKDGRLAIYLLEPSQLLPARAAIETVFGSDRIPAAGVRALQGQYTVSQLKRWSERAAVVFESPGVTAIDLDEARNRVMIGVEDDSGTRAVEQALSRLDIPRDAVVIQITKPIKPLAGPGKP